MVELTINGKQIEVPENYTVLEACKDLDIEVPTLCYNEVLEPHGACRLCIVEVEGFSNLPTSCTLNVEEGMEVYTHSEKVKEIRKNILSLLIADHPLDCLTCEESGNCKLQDYCYEYNVSGPIFGSNEKEELEIKDENPFIEYDPNKCILCGRCVKIDQEVQCSDALEFSQRGHETRVSTPYEQDLSGEDSDCVFCGQCVEVCPTGALTYKPFKGQGREFDIDNKVQTTCPYCGVGCQLELNIKDNEVVKVSSIYKDGLPNSAGEACIKGRFGYQFINNPDRLTQPLIKRDGEFEEASWDEALDYVAENLTEVKEEYGSQAVGNLTSARCTNEDNYLIQKFMRVVIGTNNVDHCAHLCHSPTVAGLAKSFGSGAMTNSISEIETSDVIFVTGSNTTEAHPVIGSKIKKAVNNGTKLIVADPRDIELSSVADIAVNQEPGSDIALMNGLMHVIIEEDLHDKEFIEERTEGFEALKELVKDYTPEKVEKITGVPAEDIIEMARLYASGDRGAIYYAMGITQHKSGTKNVTSIACLAMLTGNMGREGTGVNPLRGQNNVQGACDLGGLPNVYPGYQNVDNSDIQEKFETAWGAELSDEAGLTVVEMFNAIDEEEIKSLYIVGENPVISDPNQNHIEEALEELEFLVVQDIFLTETAEYADVVLPAACFAEKEGTFTNSERRIQRVRKAVSPPGEAKADWEIVCDLANRMGYEMNYESPAEVMEEIADLTPIYGGIDYDRVEDKGLQWPCPDKDHPGTKFLHEGEFAHGKGIFHPVDHMGPIEKIDEEYNYIMMTGRMLYHYHTGTMTRNSESIDEYEPDAYVEINSEDAKDLGIETGDRVKVASRRGEVETYAKVGDVVKPGKIFMPFHYAESPANRLTNDELDPEGKIPEYKVTAVKIEKVDNDQ